jgi:hypothetical protein
MGEVLGKRSICKGVNLGCKNTKDCPHSHKHYTFYERRKKGVKLNTCKSQLCSVKGKLTMVECKEVL